MTEAAISALGAVDVGGSGVRVRVQVGDRSLQARRNVPLPQAGEQLDVPHLCRNVLVELRTLVAEHQVQRLDALAIGMTGMPGLVPAPVEVARELWAGLDLDVVVIASDALTTHLGALGGREGAVVAAGTGAISLGTDHLDLWRQVDGWGHFVGDDGSGSWIGRKGLAAALRSVDGRPGGSPALAEYLRSQFGGPLGLVASVHGAEAPPALLASFAPAVAEAARGGDPLALRIWQEAGSMLADAGIAAVRDLVPRVSWGGGLFDVGDLLTDPFRARVRQVLGTEVSKPQGTALDGALLLARAAAAGEVSTREPYRVVFTRSRRPPRCA